MIVFMFMFLLMIILCCTEQQSWRSCPHSLWQVWPSWPRKWPPSAPPSIFFSTWRFSDLQAPAAAKTLLLDPTKLRAFSPGWQLQPRGVHEPLLVDGEPGVDGQRSLLGLGGRRVVWNPGIENLWSRWSLLIIFHHFHSPQMPLSFCPNHFLAFGPFLVKLWKFVRNLTISM